MAVPKVIDRGKQLAEILELQLPLPPPFKSDNCKWSPVEITLDDFITARRFQRPDDFLLPVFERIAAHECVVVSSIFADLLHGNPRYFRSGKTFRSELAVAELLQGPIAILRLQLDKTQSQNIAIPAVVGIGYEFVSRLLSSNIQRLGSSPAKLLNKTTFKVLLSMASSSRDRQLITYRVMQAAALSGKAMAQQYGVYGANDVKARVTDAMRETLAVREACFWMACLSEHDLLDLGLPGDPQFEDENELTSELPGCEQGTYV